VSAARATGLTAKERAEHARLLDLWVERRATVSQIAKCMAYDRRCAAGANGSAS
jgi:hypothetical protein